MQVKPSLAKKMISTYLKSGLVPLIKGSPGLGKSQICQQIADDYNLKLIDIRLGQCDVTDLCGFPMIQGKKAGYVPMNTFPIEGDPIPAGYKGWLILFDEITSAVPALQAASYKILLDRKIGEFPLHKNVAMCAAGNKEDDNAVVMALSTALQSRLVHLELVADAKEWVEWATQTQIDYRITSYINFKPGNLYTFSPDHSDDTYACPRTWAFADRLLKDTDTSAPEMLPMLAGTISEGVAREFLGFCKIFQDIPTIDQIIANPTGISVSSEPSILFAMTGSLAHNATMESCSQLMKYIKRLPIEFQVVCLREMTRRNKSLLANPSIQAWVSESAAELF